VVDSETGAVGGGHGHSNQQTTECAGTLFEGSASDFFGNDLPAGLSVARNAARKRKAAVIAQASAAL